MANGVLGGFLNAWLVLSFYSCYYKNGGLGR